MRGLVTVDRNSWTHGHGITQGARPRQGRQSPDTLRHATANLHDGRTPGGSCRSRSRSASLVNEIANLLPRALHDTRLQALPPKRRAAQAKRGAWLEMDGSARWRDTDSG